MPWGAPPAVLDLSNDEVHVWRVELDVSSEIIDRTALTLTDDERARANRYRSPVHQARFARGRGVLRAILSRYLSCEPGDVRFRYGARGKPALDDVGAPSGIEFNVSHSGGLALCAVTIRRMVGVDVEAIRADKPLRRLSERFFSRGEAAALGQLAPEEQTAAFFQYWTLKEAYIKARGEGLAIPLDRFEVMRATDELNATLRVEGEPSETERWTLARLAIDAGYAAALAVEGRVWRLVRWAYLD